jgi:hypothetical protein
MYERFQELRAKFDGFVDKIEDRITTFVEQLAEDIPPVGLLILFVNMSIANVEAVRAFLYIFQFVEDAFNRGVSAFNATSTFFDTVG